MKHNFKTVLLTVVLTIGMICTAQASSVTTTLIADPGTMNPITSSSTAEVIMTRVLFDGLTRSPLSFVSIGG